MKGVALWTTPSLFPLIPQLLFDDLAYGGDAKINISLA